jgi:hypothetical protein
MGNVMPGSGLLNITQATKKEINELNSDYIVIWGGSNDISKNESSKALKRTTKFALQHWHTNIVFVPALHRHGLVKSSCINMETLAFNRRLGKLTNTMLHVKLHDLTLDRDEFTRHGLHLNSKRKEKIARTIRQHLVNLLNRQDRNVLRLPWIDVNEDSNTQLQADDSGGVRSSKVDVNTVRASER